MSILTRKSFLILSFLILQFLFSGLLAQTTPPAANRTTTPPTNTATTPPTNRTAVPPANQTNTNVTRRLNRFESATDLHLPSLRIRFTEARMAFHYHFFADRQVMHIGLTIAQEADYIAIGFTQAENAGTMVNLDILAFVFVNSTAIPGTKTVQVLDLHSTHNGRPPRDIDVGGRTNVRLLRYHVSEGKRQVLIERPYNTSDPYDYAFHPSQHGVPIAIAWAWNLNGQSRLLYHGQHRGTMVLPLYYPGMAAQQVAGGEIEPQENVASGAVPVI